MAYRVGVATHGGEGTQGRHAGTDGDRSTGTSYV